MILGAGVRCGRSLVATPIALLLAASTAGADPRYADDVEVDLGLSAPPSCSLCHPCALSTDCADGGAWPVDTPFGIALLARGAPTGAHDAAAEEALRAALDQMRRDGVDSDGDGARDLDELAWGGDPNHADLVASSGGPPPNYGCAAAKRSVRRVPCWPVVLGALATWFVRRRKALT